MTNIEERNVLMQRRIDIPKLIIRQDIISLEDVFKKFNWSMKEINNNKRYINNLRYANDMILNATAAPRANNTRVLRQT